MISTEYRFGNVELQEMIQSVVNREEFDEFRDLREYPPVLRVGEVFYSSKEVFADSVKKKLGGSPVKLAKAPDWVRCITAAEDSPGVEFVILVDTAVLAGYSREAQESQFHRVLSYLKLQGKIDNDSGEWVIKTENGRPIYKMEMPEALSPDTIRRYGVHDHASAELANAMAEAALGQKMIDWEPRIADDS